MIVVSCNSLQREVIRCNKNMLWQCYLLVVGNEMNDTDCGNEGSDCWTYGKCAKTILNRDEFKMRAGRVRKKLYILQ